MPRFDEHTWALVLAAGEGSRLRSLTTTPSGLAIPKQFCSLRDGPSLLHEALQRAERIVPRERICTIVAMQHRVWWNKPLQMLDPLNIIVQPENRGTANGILLPLLHILKRDPEANIVLLPADHYVRDESILENALRKSVAELGKHPDRIVLLGISPEEADPELGYILPVRKAESNADSDYTIERVREFVEKPDAASAGRLIERGALWNAFILAVRARSLLAIFESRYPEIVMLMREIVRRDRDAISMQDLYSYLPNIDFSRGIAQGSESNLEVMRVPRCGWSDLGTPKRVIESLRVPAPSLKMRESIFQSKGHLNLAERHAAQRTG